jgi:hypothetical protein
MRNVLIIFILSICVVTGVLGQTPISPKIHLEVSDTMVFDVANNSSFIIPANMHRITNFNHSVNLEDSTVALAFDSLRTDSIASIITVYETDKQ